MSQWIKRKYNYLADEPERREAMPQGWKCFYVFHKREKSWWVRWIVVVGTMGKVGEKFVLGEKCVLFNCIVCILL